MKKTTLGLIIGFVLFWNSGFIGAEYVLPFAPPFTQLFWRYLGLTLVMYVYLKYRGQFKCLSWRKVYPQLIIGVLAHGVWLSCSLFAIAEGVPAGIVALIVSLQPITTGTLEGMVTGQRTTAQQWLGLIIGFSGVALSVIFRIELNDSVDPLSFSLPLGAVIAFTIASLYQRKRQYENKETMDVDLSLFYQSLGTMLVLFFPALFFENLSTEWTFEFVISTTWLIIGVSLLAYKFMWMLIERISATRVASLFYLGPPVTMLMA